MSQPVIAVDIGNSRIKLGWFAAVEQAASDKTANGGLAALPTPRHSISLASDWQENELQQFLPENANNARWLIASVQRTTAARLTDWLQAQGADWRLLGPADLPLTVRLERPDLVGVDRLVNAVAANRLRDPRRPAIVIDLGSAITVDVVDAAGDFRGGAILPGIGMSARAMHEFTDLLPLLTVSELADPPPALGVSTSTAMRSGMFWGAVGAVRELIARLSVDFAHPQVFSTGGAAPSVAELFHASPAGHDLHAAKAQYVPHLTLSGIAACLEYVR